MTAAVGGAIPSFSLRPPGSDDASFLFQLAADHDLRWSLPTRLATVLTPAVVLHALQSAAEVGYIVEDDDGRPVGVVGLIDADVGAGTVALDGVALLHDPGAGARVRRAVARVLDEAAAAGTVRRVFHDAYDELGPPIMWDSRALWDAEVVIPQYARIDGSWRTRTTYTLRISRWIREGGSVVGAPWTAPDPVVGPEPEPTTYPSDPGHASRVRLRPVSGDDYATLLALETSPDVLQSWRLRGRRPADPAEYERGLWFGMADQRIIESTATGKLLGLVQLYNVDLRLHQGWFSVIVDRSYRPWGVAFEGVALFLWRCFTEWDLRRVYFLSIGDNFDAFGSLESRAGYHVYGTLKDRTYVAGELADVVIGGVERAEWMTGHGRLLHRIAERARRHPTTGEPPAASTAPGTALPG